MSYYLFNDKPLKLTLHINCIEWHMREKEGSCSCDSYPIGMGYVPWQEFKDLYDPDRGLHAGTIFMELDKPFTGRRCVR